MIEIWQALRVSKTSLAWRTAQAWVSGGFFLALLSLAGQEASSLGLVGIAGQALLPLSALLIGLCLTLSHSLFATYVVSALVWLALSIGLAVLRLGAGWIVVSIVLGPVVIGIASLPSLLRCLLTGRWRICRRVPEQLWLPQVVPAHLEIEVPVPQPEPLASAEDWRRLRVAPGSSPAQVDRAYQDLQAALVRHKREFEIGQYQRMRVRLGQIYERVLADSKLQAAQIRAVDMDWQLLGVTSTAPLEVLETAFQERRQHLLSQRSALGDRLAGQFLRRLRTAYLRALASSRSRVRRERPDGHRLWQEGLAESDLDKRIRAARVLLYAEPSCLLELKHGDPIAVALGVAAERGAGVEDYFSRRFVKRCWNAKKELAFASEVAERYAAALSVYQPVTSGKVLKWVFSAIAIVLLLAGIVGLALVILYLLVWLLYWLFMILLSLLPFWLLYRLLYRLLVGRRY